MIDDELLSILEDEVSEEFMEALTAHATLQMETHIWHGEEGGPSTGDMEPADYAMVALTKVMNEEEGAKWNRAKYPSLMNHLRFVVTKEIKNAARRHDNTRVKRVEDDDTFGIDTASLSTLTEVEAKSLREGFLRFLRKVATKDVEELDFVKSCQEDGYTRQEIADLMSVAPEKITNLQKRVCRRWAEYVDQEWPGHQETLS